MKSFLAPLQADSQLIDPKVVDTIFSNIEEVVSINNTMLLEIEDRVANNWTEEQTVGKLLPNITINNHKVTFYSTTLPSSSQFTVTIVGHMLELCLLLTNARNNLRRSLPSWKKQAKSLKWKDFFLIVS
jgi:hypothetical protein